MVLGLWANKQEVSFCKLPISGLDFARHSGTQIQASFHQNFNSIIMIVCKYHVSPLPMNFAKFYQIWTKIEALGQYFTIHHLPRPGQDRTYHPMIPGTFNHSTYIQTFPGNYSVQKNIKYTYEIYLGTPLRYFSLLGDN